MNARRQAMRIVRCNYKTTTTTSDYIEIFKSKCLGNTNLPLTCLATKPEFEEDVRLLLWLEAAVVVLGIAELHVNGVVAVA